MFFYIIYTFFDENVSIGNSYDLHFKVLFYTYLCNKKMEQLNLFSSTNY